MSYHENDFAGEIGITLLIHHAYSNLATELAAILTALGSDTTTHDRTITTPATALCIGSDKSRFTNDILLTVNKGWGGNLTSVQMVSGIQDATGVVHAPVNIDVPYAQAATTPAIGVICTVTNGNWGGSPTGYTYQWTRNGTNISLATAQSYPLVAADIGGKAIACVVTATNATGSTAAPPSNAIAT